ncbi:MAG: hypothetical protein GAK43_01633 [Stenotrophomonas maltophilia]|nr:MAG: hypothetical protein GAK43_01633 [Stenotrophomonas maltophilia]
MSYRSQEARPGARTSDSLVYQHRAIGFCLFSIAACLLIICLPLAAERGACLAMAGAALSIGAMLVHGQLNRALTHARRDSAHARRRLVRLRQLSMLTALAGFLLWAGFSLGG